MWYQIRKLIAKWKYRKVPDGLCGCGAMIDEHGIDYSHTPVDSNNITLNNTQKEISNVRHQNSIQS